MRIPTTIYSSYITLSRKDALKLFWKECFEDAEIFFSIHKELPHPRQSITTKTLDVKNNGKNWEQSIQNIPIHLPFTKQTQVILTQQDAKKINIDAPKTTPGNLQNAKWLKIIWPQSSIYLPQCAIILQPHLCISKSDAEHLWLRQNQKISIQIKGQRIKSKGSFIKGAFEWSETKYCKNNIIFHEIKVKIKDSYILDLSLTEDLIMKNNILSWHRGEIV